MIYFVGCYARSFTYVHHVSVDSLCYNCHDRTRGGHTFYRWFITYWLEENGTAKWIIVPLLLVVKRRAGLRLRLKQDLDDLVTVILVLKLTRLMRGNSHAYHLACYLPTLNSDFLFVFRLQSKVRSSYLTTFGPRGYDDTASVSIIALI